MSTESSPCASGRRKRPKDLVLPDGLRKKLASPMGPVIQESDLPGFIGGEGRKISVGDVVTATLLRNEIVPDLMIFDYRTQRRPCDDQVGKALDRAPGKTLRVKNPAGTITTALWLGIEKSLESGETSKIIVEGEEDLASLACISIGDSGDYVIYGIPNEGIAVIRINDATKEKIDGLLMKMEQK